MSEQTSIEWAEVLFPSRSAVVADIVAVPAEGHTIRHVVSQIGMIGPRLEMVRVQVAALPIATIPTREIVLPIDGRSPRDVIRRETSVRSFIRPTVNEPRMRRTARRSLFRACANPSPLFRCAWFPCTALVPMPGRAHARSRFGTVTTPFERRDRRIFRVNDMRAGKALSRKPVSSAAVAPELVSRLPSVARMTPLEAGSDPIKVLVQRQPDSLCCNLEHACLASQASTSTFNYRTRRVIGV